MYAIVKTGGKQYRVAAGDTLNVEKLPAKVGDKVSLQALCVVDGSKVETDPSKAAETHVTAVVLDQFRGEKQIVFKFKKRKNYAKKRGHRQPLTRIGIESVGPDCVEFNVEKPSDDGIEDVPSAPEALEGIEDSATEAPVLREPQQSEPSTPDTVEEPEGDKPALADPITSSTSETGSKPSAPETDSE